MRYTVVWTPDALNELTELYVNATDRADVTAASNRIDATLATDPYGQSESRSGNSRIMIVPPLAVSFDVSDPDCLVTVWAVWRLHGRHFPRKPVHRIPVRRRRAARAGCGD
jgi:plasmid stabilization system protein ParE